MAVSGPGRRAGEGRGDDRDDGLPDIIVWRIDGDGLGDAVGVERLEMVCEMPTRTWWIDGEEVDGSGMSACLLLWRRLGPAGASCPRAADRMGGKPAQRLHQVARPAKCLQKDIAS